MPILCQKMSILSKTLCSHVIFFHFSMKNPLLSIGIFSQKHVNSVKITLYYGQKRQDDAIFSGYFIKTLCSHADILSKNVHSLKKYSYSHILSEKRPFSQNTLLSCHFFKLFMKNPLLSCPYLVIKYQFC